MSSGRPSNSGIDTNSCPGQAQLAGAVHPRMAGQHLLDQGRAGARQAEDEHRHARVVAGPGQAVEQLRREAGDEPID